MALLPASSDLIANAMAERNAEDQLYEFVKQAWAIIEPGTPFSPNWHLEKICDHLEAVSNGEIRRLLINIPPRHSKSSICSVLWPVWEWICDPTQKFLCASYSATLSTRDALKSRRLIQSPWFQERWGDRFAMTGDQNVKSRYENDKTGYRIATSVSGGTTGDGGSRLCLVNTTMLDCEDGRRRSIGDIVNEQFQGNVRSWDGHRAVWRAIKGHYTSTPNALLRIRFASGRVLQCTPEHRVYTLNRGYIEAKNLAASDHLLRHVREGDTAQSLATDIVTAIEIAKTPDRTYCIDVEDTHCFFADGVLVHNCLDDPIGASDAQSDAVRESTLEFFDTTWSTRLNNPKKDAMVTIMQRLHERDVSGRILELGGWEHVCIPAEWDGVRRTTVLGNYDPRTTKGDLLWPERVGRKELDLLKEQLGAYATAGQLQQAPAPDGGGLIDTTQFQMWPAEKPFPYFEYVVQAYDTAFTAKTTGDPTACGVYGVFRNDGSNKMCVMLLDAWAEHMDYPVLRQRVIDDWGNEYGEVTSTSARRSRPRRADIALVENKGSGQALLTDLSDANIYVRSYDLPRGSKSEMSKVSRVHLITPIIDAKCFFIPESRKNTGKFISWSEGLVHQCKMFPAGAHDDEVDCLSMALFFLKESGWFELKSAPVDEVEEEKDYGAKKQHENPYAV